MDQFSTNFLKQVIRQGFSYFFTNQIKQALKNCYTRRASQSLINKIENFDCLMTRCHRAIKPRKSLNEQKWGSLFEKFFMSPEEVYFWTYVVLICNNEVLSLLKILIKKKKNYTTKWSIAHNWRNLQNVNFQGPKSTLCIFWEKYYYAKSWNTYTKYANLNVSYNTSNNFEMKNVSDKTDVSDWEKPWISI